MLGKVVLPEDHTFLLEDVVPPDTVHLPHAFPIRRSILPPRFPTHRVQDIICGATGRKRERASPVSDRSWVARCKHKRLESRCWERIDTEKGRMRPQIRTDVRKVQICLVVKLVEGWEIYITSVRFIHHLVRSRDAILRVIEYGDRKVNPHRSRQHSPYQRVS